MPNSQWPRFIELLHKEVVPALGCTEPVAVALAAAHAVEALGCQPENIKVLVSGNLLKNGMGVGVPGTGATGMNIAAAVGAIGGKAARGLEVLAELTPEQAEAGRNMVEAGRVHVGIAEGSPLLYAEVLVEGGGHTGRAVLEHEQKVKNGRCPLPPFMSLPRRRLLKTSALFLKPRGSTKRWLWKAWPGNTACR